MFGLTAPGGVGGCRSTGPAGGKGRPSAFVVCECTELTSEAILVVLGRVGREASGRVGFEATISMGSISAARPGGRKDPAWGRRGGDGVGGEGKGECALCVTFVWCWAGKSPSNCDSPLSHPSGAMASLSDPPLSIPPHLQGLDLELTAPQTSRHCFEEGARRALIGGSPKALVGCRMILSKGEFGKPHDFPKSCWIL